jgi:hypothetical protein
MDKDNYSPQEAFIGNTVYKMARECGIPMIQSKDIGKDAIIEYRSNRSPKGSDIFKNAKKRIKAEAKVWKKNTPQLN